MLSALDAASVLDDLRFPPGNNLEAMHGDQKGQNSIRSNQQWRICFVWTSEGPKDVEIAYYHTEEMCMSLVKHPSHPGEVLHELYLMPLGMSAIMLARRLHVPRTRIERLLRGETAMTADTAIRLAKFFSTTPEYWMNLQRARDLAQARDTIDVSAIEPLKAA